MVMESGVEQAVTTPLPKKPWSLNEHCAVCETRLKPFRWIGRGGPAFCAEHSEEATRIGSKQFSLKYGRDFWNGRSGRTDQEQEHFLAGLNPYTGEDDRPFR